MASRNHVARGLRAFFCLSLSVILQPAPVTAFGSSLIRRQDVASSKQQQSPVQEEATRLINKADDLYEKGRYSDAIRLAERALNLEEKSLGPNHPDIVSSFNYLASLYIKNGAYSKAEPLFQRALKVMEKAPDTNPADFASLLNNYAYLHSQQANYDEAEQMYQRALEIREKSLGAEDSDVALSLNNLARVASLKGDYDKAEQLYTRSLNMLENLPDTKAQDLAKSFNNLAELYDRTGDVEKAERLYQRALEIWEKAVGPDHPDLAIPLNNLAVFYDENGEYDKARPSYERALAIREKALGAEHPRVAQSLSGLGSIYYSKGDYAEAESLFRRALAIREKALGQEHPAVATSLNNLGRLYHRKGEYALAEPLLRRALEIREKTLGPQDQYVALSLDRLALLYEALGDLDLAVACRKRAGEINERLLNFNLATGSERQKFLFWSTFSNDSDATISLHLQSAQDNPEASRLALLTILRRQGRAVEAASDTLKTLSNSLDRKDQALLDQWKLVLSQLATLSLKPPNGIDPAPHLAEIRRLEEQKENLEKQISRRSAAFRIQTRPVTMEDVQQALPAGAVLINFFTYSPINPKNDHRGEPRYVACVLGRDLAPAWADLGEMKAIDEAVEALRLALRNPKREDVRRLARALDEQVMLPVRRLIGNSRWLMIAPERMLNLIPFAALVDENNRYLVENYLFTYLTSGRDLLRLQQSVTSRQQPPLIIANPAFDEIPSPAVEAQRNSTYTAATRGATTRGGSLPDMPWEELKSSLEEANEIQRLFPKAKVLKGRQATEAALRRINAPLFLHIATHGFFLANTKPTPATPRESSSTRGGEKAEKGVSFANPLSRSGLALAGANMRRGSADGSDDGYLTALELAGLNLWGTKLVALSACDTGVGEVKNGDGVYGLRRALVLAGSESQVMSLWNVADDATKELMTNYYKALKLGDGRSQAMRQVQLKMLKDEVRNHPFYWAGFIQSGQWEKLWRIAPENKPTTRVKDRRSRARN
jgi:CHAT domain-containing protein/Tfp pilus assembly protein PilF